MDQGSTMKRSAVHNFAPTVTKFCVMWEGLSLPHDTKFGNSRCEIVGRRVIFIWSLIHGLRWSGLIKVGPGHRCPTKQSGHITRVIHMMGICNLSPRGLDYWMKSMLKSILLNKDVQNVASDCCQEIRCQLWKSMLTNMDIGMEISWKSRSQIDIIISRLDHMTNPRDAAGITH